MSVDLDIFSELEKKVTMLIDVVQTLKNEKKQSGAELEAKTGRIGELEGENRHLKQELEALKNNCDDRQKKIEAAADKIQGLLSKLETVEA
ncbi:MAG: cell division protein ZapB [Chitinivibrionales bacterium]|nr:cell division protein ZapB [Chitinivibrionales bacterium]